MRQLNSYTLNSKGRSTGKAIGKSIAIGLWIIFFLLVIDVAVNFLFPYPSDPRISSHNQLSVYFNYGRSLEGKLSQMVGATDESSSALTQAGWIDPDSWKKLHLPTTRATGEDRLVAIYGMSFSNEVGAAIKEINSKITLRMIAAPAAGPNYSFAAYNQDRGRHQADVVILGVLASSVKALKTMNGMTWQFEMPAPYTYPRYFLEDDLLKEVSPKISSLAQLRATLASRQQRDAFLAQLRDYDEFFDSFLFEQNFLDNSAIVRMIRRAWAQRHQKAIEQKIHNSHGFNPENEIPVLRKIVTEFAATAQKDGKMPIVLLFNDRGYDDHLFRALEPTLKSASIPYVSTHKIAPATNLDNFLPDGHFTTSVNKKIAEAVLQLIG
ncbi:MAG: hypothetical protein DSM106950_20365 [Stigonema ocellatum SAG 48.90 = DSM 106950]|nr:hypothetical protein [Stigonema ocellatum SAG 48.90 = DSM 106950]